MTKNVFRKGLVIGIIILFVGASVVPSFVGMSIKKQCSTENMTSFMTFNSRGNTLYVGGSGPGNYSKIQDAIDNASDGDTVFVYDDSSPYYENVIVDKSINLIGEDRDTTIIDGNGSGDVVYVSADWVNITGFTIQNCGSNGQDRGIEIISNSNTITGNNISNNNDGIRLGYSNSNTITDNNISNNEDDGIFLYYSNSNTITGNNISNNEGDEGDGIWLGNSNSNTITGNNISNTGDGIHLGFSSSNIITGNNITSNNYYGIFIGLSSSNTIYHNNFIDNTDNVYSYSSSNIWNSTSPITYTYNGNTYTNYMGNHWDDYTGSDADGDGIGDTPYNIDDDNNDYYPLMEPFENYFIGGNQPPTVEITYPVEGQTVSGTITITGTADDLDGTVQQVEVKIDDGSWEIATGTTSWSYIWDTTTVPDGLHTIYARSYDGEDYSLLDYVNVNVENNQNPNTPETPSGPTIGEINIEYEYSTSTTDPDNDNIEYGWDWDGDSIVDEWTAFYPSGNIVTTSHSWEDPGVYYVKVKAEDIHGAQSDFSEPLEVTITGGDLPDLIIDDIELSNENPEEGDEVTITVVLKNIGAPINPNSKLNLYLVQVSSNSVLDLLKIEINLEQGLNQGETKIVTLVWVAVPILTNMKGLQVRIEPDFPEESSGNIEWFNVDVYCPRDFMINPDTYHFENWELTDEEVEQIISGITGAYGKLPDIIKKIIPYEGFLSWLHDFIQKRSGYCYGMSSTSYGYYKDMIDIPGNDPVYEMEKSDPGVEDNICWYHRYQFPSILPFIILNLIIDPQTKFEFIASSVSNEHPVLINYFVKTSEGKPGHSVLAYNTNGDYVICYDNNYPGMGRAMKFDFNADQVYWVGEENTPFSIFSAEYPILAYDDFLIKLINVLWEYINNIIYGCIDDLKNIFSFHCPINVTFTDEFGRILNETVNEIPNAEYQKIGDIKYFYVPFNLSYDIVINGYDTGNFSFSHFRPLQFSEDSVQMLGFNNISILKQSRGYFHISDDNEIYQLSMDYDDDGYIDEELNADINITVKQNNPPDTPTINGPSSGKPGREYKYSFCSNDPDDEDLFYFIDWGDGLNTGWLGPYNSGITITKSHKWSDTGNYSIRAIVRDSRWYHSNWSDPMPVSMPRNKAINIPFLQFLQNFLQQYPILYQLLQRFLRL